MSFLSIPIYNFIVNKDVFVSDYFSITGQEISLEHFSSNYTFNTKITNFPIVSGKSLKITPLSAGSLQIQYTATNQFSDTLPQTINIFQEWEKFDETNARFVFEKKLQLPNPIEEVLIQPNEWGVADVFNNSISKLHENLTYLISNTRILNSKAPSFYYGWFGSSLYNTSVGPRWYCKNFGEKDSLNPTIGSGDYPGFTNVIDFFAEKYISIVLDKINSPTQFVSDNFLFRFFLNDASSTEIFLDSSLPSLESLFVSPVAITFDPDTNCLYVLDSIQNKLQKIKLEFGPTFLYYIDNYIQGFGYEFDSNSFNTPTEMFLFKGKIWVLDYGNQCIKKYSRDLFWEGTYLFPKEYKITHFSVHPSLFLFLFSTTGEIIVLNSVDNQIIYKFSLLPYITDSKLISKVIIDEAGEFLYTISDKKIYKFTSSGYFITTLDLPSLGNLSLNGGFTGYNKNLYFFTEHLIFKVQDFVETFKIGQAYNKFYWPLDKLLLDPKEFASDVPYNRCISRLIQNIKNFRDSIDHNIVEIKETLNGGVVTYLTLAPINNDLPLRLHPLLEENELKLGVNDFHVPQIFNSILRPIHGSLQKLSEFLDIKPLEQYTITQSISSDNLYSPCQEFCWSWKAMSYMSSGSQVVKVCGYNPVSWQELKSDVATNPKSWNMAISPCCE